MIGRTTTAALAALAFAAPVWAQGERLDGRYYGHMWDGGWGMVGFGTMLLFWGLIIALIVVAVRWLWRQVERAANAGRAPGAR